MKIINFLGGFLKTVLLLFVLAAALFTASQTAYSPPDFKVAADLAFESAVKAAEPVKKYFPKPTLPEQKDVRH